MSTAELGVCMGWIAAVSAALVIGASIGFLVGAIVGWFAYDLGCTPPRRTREHASMPSGDDAVPSLAPGDGEPISTGYRQKLTEWPSANEPAKRYGLDRIGGATGGHVSCGRRLTVSQKCAKFLAPP
jgi:hypothetical protein